ncbi:MAG: hypothetical protein IH841_07835 [Thaumarchaeota archaeon]|nr:hypothetical protein [Nitrososphaerota archaeon]
MAQSKPTKSKLKEKRFTSQQKKSQEFPVSAKAGVIIIIVIANPIIPIIPKNIGDRCHRRVLGGDISPLYLFKASLSIIPSITQ